MHEPITPLCKLYGGAILALLLLLGGCLPSPHGQAKGAAAKSFNSDIDPGTNGASDPDIAVIEQEIGGRIGAYAFVPGESRPLLAHRAGERFAMASTFKPLLVAAVLSASRDGQFALDETVDFAGIEIQPHSPVTGPAADGGTLTIRELCIAAITQSDNTATNVLLGRIDGPAGFTRFLRSHGDDVSRLDRYEIALNENAPGDERDTSTPAALAASYALFALGDVLHAEDRGRLVEWLQSSRTGLKRLRAGLPADWVAGDKTGFGARGAVNNVAIAWPPDGPPLVIAVLLTGSETDTATLNAAHARIAALAAARYTARR